MVRAYILIATQPGRAIEVVARMRGQVGVAQADAVTGEYDAIATLEADDVGAIGALIVERIQRIAGVTRTVTCLAIE